ncbi:MAG: hypothetical protein IJD09_00830, partial [Clostridia bacterium]|nr:hypothetical protein [Clostridia bacterium]
PCFKKADFRSPFVKILANASALAAFYALIEQKSALFKIFDLKARRFRGIFAGSFMQIGCRRSNKNK